MPQDITILKDPQLPQSADYGYLRSKGLEYIEKLGSRLWTDYNIHDPGITLLELLCYAITDLGYRTGLDTKDILTGPLGSIDKPARQAFFTAREIMTTGPLTQADYRKLLIDIDGIRNGWMQCKSCGCEDHYLYADCKTSSLLYTPTNHKITLKGMYDVLVEFEDAEGVGNLNNGKIKYSFPFTAGSKLTNATIEMRLPSWHEIEDNLDDYGDLKSPGTVTAVTVDYISANKTDNANIPALELANALRGPIFVTLRVDVALSGGGAVQFPLADVPATLWFRNDDERREVTLNSIKTAIEDASASGILPRYHDRIAKANEVINEVRRTLQYNRNLCEDYCTVKAVETEEIAVCADIDVTPDADIEKVMAQAYYIADQYMSTDIKFYSLRELMDAGKPVDEIFDGPMLGNGFIDSDQLETTQLKTVLHTSDLINLLMDIPGVAAVRNFTLVRYDRDGYRSEAQSWSMDVSYNHQPRLYLEGSKLVAYKNGLPFLPDKQELSDTLQVIKGQNIQPKYSLADMDIAVPTGDYYPLSDYYPLQYSLPITYGVGQAGLPAHVSAERRVQAAQLKAYLLFFEQMLVNYLEQLKHVKDFFSLDETIDRSYFSRLLTNADIQGVTGFYNTASGILTQDILNSMIEDEATFLDRRNRFLDHLLSRFAEQFADYTLMVYAYNDSKKLADKSLIKDKISFLRNYPTISMNRGIAYNYKDTERVCHRDNVAGIQKRIESLLGFKGLVGNMELVKWPAPDDDYYRWQLSDDEGNILLWGGEMISIFDWSDTAAILMPMIADIQSNLADRGWYQLSMEDSQWTIQVKASHNRLVAKGGQYFATQEEATAFADLVAGFINGLLIGERIYVVEHLLMRPRNWGGDPLLPICIPPDCNACGEDDPYSFRLSIIMNGEEGLAASGIEFRSFAEETIRTEIPAHLGLKICWIDNDQMEEFGTVYCEWQNELAREEPDQSLLQQKLIALLDVFGQLKNVYPPAKLHDCAEGSEESRVYLNHTII